MTVSTEISREEYTGNGVTTDFDYRFRVFSADELVVTVADTTENISTLVLNTDYTVTGAGSRTGGKVKLVNPLAVDWRISIERDLPATQETSIRNQGNFFPEVHEDVFDKLTMLIQQAFGVFGLALRKPNWLSKYYDAKGNRIVNLGNPINAQDSATKSYVDSRDDALFNRTLRVPEPSVNMLRPVAQRNRSLLGFNDLGQPVPIFSMTDTADLAIRLASSAGANLVGWHDTTVGDYLDHLTQLVMHTTPESHGAVGDGVTDDTAAWAAAMAMNVHVIADPRKTYNVNSSIFRPFSNIKIHVDGRGCRLNVNHFQAAFRMNYSTAPDPSIYDEFSIANTVFHNITAFNAASRMSKYNDVLYSVFAKVNNGGVSGCNLTGFCDAVVMLGNSYYFNNYTTNCRDNALTILGDSNRGGAIVGGVTGGDSILCKSNYSVFGDISFIDAGVLPMGHPDGDNAPGGSLLAFAQDGNNAIGNIFGNARCQRHGAGGIIMNGENNYVNNIDVGSFVDESRSHNPAGGAWVVYMAGKNNFIGGDVKADYYHSGVHMHNNSVNCHVRDCTLINKSPYGGSTLSASGVQTNCSIGNVSAFKNNNKNDEVYVAMPGIRIKSITIANFNSSYAAASYVCRILSSCYIGDIYISSAGDSTHTKTAILISANATIKRIHQDDIIAIGVDISAGANPRLNDVVVNQNVTIAVNNPVILRGSSATEYRSIMSLRVTGGAPRIEGGVVDIGSYIGQNWQGNVLATVNYPNLSPHTPNT